MDHDTRVVGHPTQVIHDSSSGQRVNEQLTSSNTAKSFAGSVNPGSQEVASLDKGEQGNESDTDVAITGGDIVETIATISEGEKRDKKYSTPPVNWSESRTHSFNGSRGWSETKLAKRDNRISTSPLATTENFRGNLDPFRVETERTDFRTLTPLITMVGRTSLQSAPVSLPSLTEVMRESKTMFNDPAEVGPQVLRPIKYFDELMDFRDIDPYSHRADEIGPTHGIPGYMSLKDVLLPPGWTRGRPLLTPQGAEDLFHATRAQRNNDLNHFPRELEGKTQEEQNRLTNEQNKQWQANFKLDNLIFNERVSIYHTHEKRKAAALLRKRLATVEASPQGILSSLPSTLEPLAVTSIPYQYNDHNHGVPLREFPSNINTRESCERVARESRIGIPDKSHPSGQGEDFNLPGTPSSNAIPIEARGETALDPTLAAVTYQDLLQRYHDERISIENLKRATETREAENERQLSTFMAQNGHLISNGEFTTPPNPPFSRSTIEGIDCVHPGQANSSSRAPVPRPPHYASSAGDVPGTAKSVQYLYTKPAIQQTTVAPSQQQPHMQSDFNAGVSWNDNSTMKPAIIHCTERGQNTSNAGVPNSSYDARQTAAGTTMPANRYGAGKVHNEADVTIPFSSELIAETFDQLYKMNQGTEPQARKKDPAKAIATGKKGKAKPKVKSATWYEPMLANANLPLSTIGPEAWKAGEEFARKEEAAANLISISKAPKARRSRAKNVEMAPIEMPKMSAATASRLVNKFGATDSTNGVLAAQNAGMTQRQIQVQQDLERYRGPYQAEPQPEDLPANFIYSTRPLDPEARRAYDSQSQRVRGPRHIPVASKDAADNKVDLKPSKQVALATSEPTVADKRVQVIESGSESELSGTSSENIENESDEDFGTKVTRSFGSNGRKVVSAASKRKSGGDRKVSGKRPKL